MLAKDTKRRSTLLTVTRFGVDIVLALPVCV